MLYYHTSAVRFLVPMRGLSSHWWKYKKVWYDSREVLLPALCHSIFCRVHVDQRPSCVVFTARFTVVQSAVLNCMSSVCLSVCLWPWWIRITYTLEMLETNCVKQNIHNKLDIITTGLNVLCLLTFWSRTILLLFFLLLSERPLQKRLKAPLFQIGSGWNVKFGRIFFGYFFRYTSIGAAAILGDRRRMGA